MRISDQEITNRLGDYLQQVAAGSQRILVEREGQPVAALVSAEDVHRLEAWDARSGAGAGDAQALLRRALNRAGLDVQWPSEHSVSSLERTPLTISGPPLSEQIIADRR
jgi:prevent-host-death family protein